MATVMDLSHERKGEKSDSVMRWPVLAFACLMMLGSYYCYDNPSALAGPMMNATKPGWNMSGIEFNLQVRQETSWENPLLTAPSS